MTIKRRQSYLIVVIVPVDDVESCDSSCT